MRGFSLVKDYHPDQLLNWISAYHQQYVMFYRSVPPSFQHLFFFGSSPLVFSLQDGHQLNLLQVDIHGFYLNQKVLRIRLLLHRLTKHCQGGKFQHFDVLNLLKFTSATEKNPDHLGCIGGYTTLCYKVNYILF